MRRLLLPLLIQLVALAAFAQTSAEFDHAFGGTLDTITKTTRHTSGSLFLNSRGYEGSLGGQLVPDRLWFFSSASILPRTHIDAKATAQPVDWNSVTASFSQFGAPQPNTGSLSQSFLSLRSTALLSNRTTLDISISQTHKK